MADLGNPAQRYSRVAILLHWIIAAALAAELAIGFGMPRDASGFALFQFHKSLGITILVLTLVRIAWRLTHPVPPAVDKGPLGLLAKAVHIGLYVFMIAAPLTGWALVSSAPINVPTLLFGVIPLPHLPIDKAFNHTIEEAHELLAFLGIALFLLHVAGALKHHFINRDGVLARMGPGGSARAALVLLVATLVLHFGVVAVLPGHEHAEEAAEAAESGASEGALGDAPADAPDAATGEQAAGLDPDTPVSSQDAVAQETAAAGPPPSWTIQPGGSLRFVADNGGTALNGSFRRWSGTIAMNPDDPAGSRIAIEIDLASATLGDATQDQMLAGSDFFAVSANPQATFRSTDVQKTGANSYRARGTLALRGVSRPQVISFTLSGSGARRAVSGSATVDRTAFGVGQGEAAAGIAPEVRVEFAFDAVREG